MRQGKSSARAGRLGFTMIELLIAMAIGAFAIAVAANVARWGAAQSGRGREGVELNSRARLAARQIRSDIEVAGYGSTGAIGIAPGGFLTAHQITTIGARQAIAAVRGVNNVSAGVTIGGREVMEGSDILMLVVPDPGSSRILGSIASIASSLQDNYASTLANLWLDTALPTPWNCPTRLLYIRDSGTSNGVGRTLLLAQPSAWGGAPALLSGGTGDQIPAGVTISAGAEVMCARISVYWLDTQGWLHRSDWRGGAPAQSTDSVGGLAVPNDQVGINDLLSPGVLDFQVAYGMSAEVNRVALSDPSRWGYAGDNNGNPVSTGDPTGNSDRNWFEVRHVRFTLLVRSLRAVSEIGSPIQELVEDRTAMATNIADPSHQGVQFSRWSISSSAVLTNLRYFDMNTLAGLPPEPY